MTDCGFDTVVCFLPQRLRSRLTAWPVEEKRRCAEIRLRAGLPVALTVDGQTRFLTENGRPVTVDALEIEDCFHRLCGDSVYAHEREIAEGFLPLPGGHRVGLCGTVTASGALRDISALNLRIARQVPGCAKPLAAAFCGEGILIAGPPGSGKTTLLRDLIRILSAGENGCSYRVTVLDSRGELAAANGAYCGNDLGPNTDLLQIQNRAAGAAWAVRTLFPQVLAFDEIGTTAELQSVAESFHAGVAVLTTAHIGSVGELMQRPVTRRLLQSGAMGAVAVLNRKAGAPYDILSAKAVCAGA